MSHIHLLKSHPDYDISSISAGEVTAATLNVQRFNEAPLPLTVEAVLTTEDAARQYQIKVVAIVTSDSILVNVVV